LGGRNLAPSNPWACPQYEDDAMALPIPDGPHAAAEHAVMETVKAASSPPAPASSHNPDVLLRRKRLAEALTACGYQITEKTLATMVTRGGGPPYHLWGRFPVYRWASALVWAEGRLSVANLTTSQEDTKQSAE
jgi:hypothetical protein